MSDLADRISFWSYRRQLLGKRGATPERTLNDIVSVSGLHPYGVLSLYSRLKPSGEKSFFRLEEDKCILRIPAMRSTIRAVTSGNAASVFSATSPVVVPRRTGAERRYQDLRQIVLKVAFRPMSAAEIRDALGIGPRDANAVLKRMVNDGDLLTLGPRSLCSAEVCLVSAAAWTDKLKPVDPGKSLSWLAGEYLRAFGPARLKDFRWWSGSKPETAKSAFMSNKIAEIENGYFILAKDLRQFLSFKPEIRNNVDVLPRWDTYLTGYAPDGRERFVEPKFLRRLFAPSGESKCGAMLVNGQAIGSWNYSIADGKMIVDFKMFRQVPTGICTLISDSFNEIAEFLQMRRAVVRER